MSIKSQEGHMRQLALLLTTDLGASLARGKADPMEVRKLF